MAGLTLKRFTATSGTIGLVGAVTGAVMVAFHLATRAPCPKGYVRLLDFVSFLPGVFAVLAIGEASVLVAQARSRAPRTLVLMATTGAVITAGVLVLTAVAVAGDLGTNGCWTF